MKVKGLVRARSRVAARSVGLAGCLVAFILTSTSVSHAANYVGNENDTWVYGNKVVERSSWCLTKEQRNRYRADASDGWTSAVSDKYLTLYVVDRRGYEDLVDADLEVRYVRDQRCEQRSKGKRPFTAEYTFRPFVSGEKVPGRNYQLLEVIDYNNTQSGPIRSKTHLKKMYLP